MGKIELDHTGSGGGITLSSDGTDLLLDGTAIGGGGGASEYTIDDKTAAYTVVSGDLGKIINCTSGTFTITLTAAATLGSGFHVTIWNLSTTSSDAITIDPNASETIDGKSTFILRRGEGVEVVCDGTNFQTGNKKAMRGHADNIPASYTPVASGNISLAMGGRATASGSLRSIAIGDNATASNSESLAIQNTSTASGSASIAIGKSTTASASNGLAIGYNAQAVSGSGATALTNSRAAGASSLAAAIANNTSSYGATGANSIAIGKQNKSTGSYGLTIGGQSNTSSGFYSGCLNTNAGTASQIYSTVINGYGTTADVGGKIAFGTSYSGWTRNPQTGLMTLFAATTDATATELLAQNTRVSLPNNSAYAFHGTIVAREQAADGTDCAAWKVEGLIRREGTASTTVLVNSATTVIDNTPSWTLALSADTTNGALKITGTGAAATDIRWVATIHTSEVTYA